MRVGKQNGIRRPVASSTPVSIGLKPSARDTLLAQRFHKRRRITVFPTAVSVPVTRKSVTETLHDAAWTAPARCLSSASVEESGGISTMDIAERPEENAAVAQ
jgi:hypothetical protein